MRKKIAGVYRLSFLLICLLLSILFLIFGCASTPVGVRKLDPKRVQRKLTTNILTTGKLSASSDRFSTVSGLPLNLNASLKR